MKGCLHRPFPSLIRVAPVPSSGATGQAEDAEINIFPIAVDPRGISFAFHRAGTSAMEKYSAACAAEKTKGINSLAVRFQKGQFITRRVEAFCFSASQRKAKKQKLSVLSGSACPMKFMSMRSEANFIGAVNIFFKTLLDMCVPRSGCSCPANGQSGLHRDRRGSFAPPGNRDTDSGPRGVGGIRATGRPADRRPGRCPRPGA